MTGNAPLGYGGPHARVATGRIVSNEMLAAALSYFQKYDVAVVPIIGKRPAAPHGYASATKDPDEIRRLFARVRATGVGIAAGDDLVIVDVDRLDGLAELGTLPVTLTTRSGGGGLHFLYWGQEGARLAYRRDRFPLGVEVKLGNAGTVAPPSIHPETGRRYSWDQVAGIADAPAWLVERLRVPPSPPPRPMSELVVGAGETRYGLAALSRYAAKIAAAPEGQRETTLHSCAFGAGQLVPTGHLRADTVEVVLHDAALATGLPEREIRWTIRQAITRGGQHPYAPERRR